MARDNDAIITSKWAASGDVGLGGLTLAQLWTLAYSTPGGLFPQRIQFNQLFRWLSALGLEINTKGPILEYAATIDYEVGAIVYGTDGIDYVAAVANGPGSAVVNPVGDLTGTWRPKSFPNIVVFLSSGIYTKPTGLKGIEGLLVAGGGGGGGVDGQGAGTFTAGGGGGSGGIAEFALLASQLAATESVTIGAGGSGGAGSGGSGGSSGGTTSFGIFVTATGGGGGNGDVAQTSFSARRGGAGGNASGGIVNYRGLPGGKGVANGVFSGRVVSGEGGGPGGGQSVQGSGAGNNALSPGSGGSGGAIFDVSSNASGGDGADGIVIIRESF